jgi:UDP-N-acetylglucosamine 2-epimerase (non-hydrolysing)
MNEVFFRQLEIPPPDITLGVGSGSHAQQTAEIIKRFEPVIDAERPQVVLVVGDVNSTLACALVAAKKPVRLVHVEAGLRSRDRTMPEEINRVVTDQLSDRLYVTERAAVNNLLSEGISQDKIVFAGNVMIDTLFWSLDKCVDPAITIGDANFVTASQGYAVLTLHRPSNVDEPTVLARLLETIADLPLPVVFPLHPRTRARIEEGGLSHLLASSNIRYLEPCNYFQMIGLIRNARLVLTDSGGLQEETTALGIPCATLRDSTERPVTVTSGTNTLVGTDPVAIRTATNRVFAGGLSRLPPPEGWDGIAAKRIVLDLAAWLRSAQ